MNETETSIAVIKEEVAPIIKEAGSLEITNGEDLKRAVEVLSSLNLLNDKVEEDRLKITKPLNDAVREVNSRYKGIKDLLTGSIASVRLKMGSYATKVAEDRAKAEEKLSKRVEAGTMKMETAVSKLESLETVDKTVNSEAGKVTFIEKENFEVVDFKLLPDDYKVVNEKAIRESMKAGVKVEGVRYFTEQVVRNTR
jgi:flagellar hook-associated protein FlgK